MTNRHAGTEAAVRDHIQAQLKAHQHELNDQGCYLLRRCLRSKRQDVEVAGLSNLLRDVREPGRHRLTNMDGPQP